MSVTRVGPPEPADFPRKKGRLHRIFRWFYKLTGAAWLFQYGWFVPSRRLADVARMTMGDDPAEGGRPPDDRGIPEADLSREERRRALERIDWEKD